MSTSTEPAMSPPSPVPPPSPPTPRPHEQKSIRIITWNVNSVKTVRQYHPWCDLPSFGAMINQLHADVVCVQETKLARTAVTREYALVDADYDAYFAFCERIGKR